MSIIIIGLIIAVIVLSGKLSDANSENKQLKRELEHWKKVVKELKEQINTAEVIKTEEVKEINSASIMKEKEFKEENPVRVKKDEHVPISNVSYKTSANEDVLYNKQRKKNSLILISGAILIVLAAVVFLTSTWNTAPNIIKTGVLTLLIGVFFGLSYIAKEKFELPQTSKAFYYMAMAYIPIVLLSISIFKLIGEFLSITGEGKFIYLSISTIFLSILYLSISLKQNNKILQVTSIVFQLLACVFTSLAYTNNTNFVISTSALLVAVLYFIEGYKFKDRTVSIFSMIAQVVAIVFAIKAINTDILIILIGLIIYNLIMTLINKNMVSNELVEDYKKFTNILYVGLVIFGLIACTESWIFASATYLNIIAIGLLLLNYHLLDIEKNNFSYVNNISILAFILTLINLKSIILTFEIKLLIMSISTTALYAINYLINKKPLHKIISYLSMNSVFLAIMKLGGILEYYIYIPMITSFIAMAIELFMQKNDCKYYVACSFVVALVFLNFNLTIASFIALLICIAGFMYFTKINKLSNEYEIIPLIALIPSIYLSKIFVIENLNFNFATILSLILITYTTLKSIINREGNVSTFFSGIYILLSIIFFSWNEYISILLVLSWAVIHTIFFKNKSVFKAISYISGLILYNKIISDFDLISIKAFQMLGYLICTYLITRTILKKENSEYKAFEYIITTIIYIYALNTYASITDAMIFIGLLVVLTVLSYLKKVGPLFIVSLFAIVINFLTLTEDFWHSIPWWIYLLTIGTILIVFAVINEKTNKDMVKNVVQKIKDKVDM